VGLLDILKIWWALKSAMFGNTGCKVIQEYSGKARRYIEASLLVYTLYYPTAISMICLRMPEGVSDVILSIKWVNTQKEKATLFGWPFPLVVLLLGFRCALLGRLGLWLYLLDLLGRTTIWYQLIPQRTVGHNCLYA